MSIISTKGGCLNIVTHELPTNGPSGHGVNRRYNNLDEGGYAPMLNDDQTHNQIYLAPH